VFFHVASLSVITLSLSLFPLIGASVSFSYLPPHHIIFPIPITVSVCGLHAYLNVLLNRPLVKKKQTISHFDVFLPCVCVANVALKKIAREPHPPQKKLLHDRSSHTQHVRRAVNVAW
jgi:hypothetical protein